ncbi:hypothetical protein ACVWXB_006148 [Streptomyces sp. TE12347]
MPSRVMRSVTRDPRSRRPVRTCSAITGRVAGRVAVAVDAAGEGAGEVEDLHGVEGDLLLLAADADDRGAAAAPGRLPGAPDGLGPADALDGHIGALPAGQRADLLGGGVGGEDELGGSGRPGQFLLGRGHVDGDDRARLRDPGGLEGDQADPADPEDGHRLARADLGAVVDRPVAGEDGAAEQGRLGERDPGGGRQDTVGRDDGLLGEGGHVQPGVQRGALGVVRVDGPDPGERRGAEPDLADGAVVALSAGRGPVEDHAVTGGDVRDALPHREDRARALVTEDGGHGDPHGAVGEGEVGVTHPGRGEPHPDLPGAGIRQHDVPYLQRGSDGGQDSGADHGRHLVFPVRGRVPWLRRVRSVRLRPQGGRLGQGGRVGPSGGQNCRDLVWRYSARPCAPNSRPTPDCL